MIYNVGQYLRLQAKKDSGIFDKDSVYVTKIIEIKYDYFEIVLHGGYHIAFELFHEYDIQVLDIDDIQFRLLIS